MGDGEAPVPGPGSRLARHHRASPVPPHLRAYVECFLKTFTVEGRLDPRLRQLSILRIAWRTAQPYEWANHYRLAKTVGVADEDIASVRQPSGQRRLDEAAAFTLDAVDELIDSGRLSVTTFDRAATVFGHADVAEEFVHLVGGYLGMSALLNTKNPSLELAGLPFWPPHGMAPDGATG